MATRKVSKSGRSKRRSTPMVRKAGPTRQGGRILCGGGKLKKK